MIHGIIDKPNSDCQKQTDAIHLEPGVSLKMAASQDVLVDAGFVYNKAGVLGDMIAGTPCTFRMLYQCYMTELPLSVTHFKILLHLMCYIVVPVLPSP